MTLTSGPIRIVDVAVYLHEGEYLLHYDVKTPLIGTADIKIKTCYALVSDMVAASKYRTAQKLGKVDTKLMGRPAGTFCDPRTAESAGVDPRVTNTRPGMGGLG
ncbi:MAG: hypothetical protein PVG22_17875 [Chromatiales bacterium]|jgi:hypothetical protein